MLAAQQTELDLSQADISAIMSQSVHNFNALIDENDTLSEEVNLLNSQLSGYKRQSANQLQELSHAQTAIELAKQEIAALKSHLVNQEKAAQTLKQLEAKITSQKETISAQQKQISELKGPGSPSRLREQIKRLKTKSGEKEKTVKAKTALAATYKKERDNYQAMYNAALDKIKTNTNGVTRIWSQDHHHVYMWPESIDLQDRETKEITHERPLLYLHGTGNAAMFMLDDKNKACKTKASRAA